MSIAIIPTLPSEDGYYNQHIFRLSVGNSQDSDYLLVLHDHSKEVFAPATGVGLYKVAGKGFNNLSVVAYDTGVDPIHLVAHLSGGDRAGYPVGFFVPGTVEARKLIVLQVSSAPVNLPCEAHDLVVWLSMKDKNAYELVDKWVPEFLKLSFDQAKVLARFESRSEASAFEAGNPGFSHFLDIVLPGRVENLLAFRLLCEAWNEVERANALRISQGEGASNTAEVIGLTIHVPEGLEQWLAPFGKKPEDEKAIEYVAGMIGSGEVRKAVESVLKAASGDGKMEDVIPPFLSAVESKNP